MPSLACSTRELVARLQAGEAAIFPTDTLPALATRPESAELLWELKQRPPKKPVILMAAEASDLLACVQLEIQPAWQQMADQYWPGALTLVLPARGQWLEQLNPGGTTLGLRVPACEKARELLRQSGPLATTSANLSGQPSCLTQEEASLAFPQVAQLGPNPWPVHGGVGSTVIEWMPSGHWKLLRAGVLMPPELGEAASSA